MFIFVISYFFGKVVTDEESMELKFLCCNKFDYDKFIKTNIKITALIKCINFFTAIPVSHQIKLCQVPDVTLSLYLDRNSRSPYEVVFNNTFLECV